MASASCCRWRGSIRRTKKSKGEITMKQKLLRLALLAGGLAFGLPAFAAGVATPAMLSSSCNACHGTDGNSAGLSNPTIAGFGADYLETAMKQFKSGERPSSVMGRLAKGYDEAQLKAMADFFASKKFVAAKQAFDATKAKQGAKLHDKSCKMCHGNGGKLSSQVTAILGSEAAL